MRRSPRLLMLSGHLIFFKRDVGWLAHSPDLTPCEFFLFFLWGCLKEKVFRHRHRPRTLENSIGNQRTPPPPDPPRLHCVIDNFQVRLPKQQVPFDQYNIQNSIVFMYFHKTFFNRQLLYFFIFLQSGRNLYASLAFLLITAKRFFCSL